MIMAVASPQVELLISLFFSENDVNFSYVSYISTSGITTLHTQDIFLEKIKNHANNLIGGGGVTPLCAPTPLCQNRICLTRGVSPGAYRGAQGRSLKNTWKMFVFNCMIHFVTCTRKYLPNHGVIGVSVASLDAESRPKSETYKNSPLSNNFLLFHQHENLLERIF